MNRFETSLRNYLEWYRVNTLVHGSPPPAWARAFILGAVIVNPEALR